VLARPNTVILGASGDLQWPRSSSSRGQYMRERQRIELQTRRGVAGYDPEEPDMRGVFMALGPGFNARPQAYPPMQLVDVYNILCHLAGVEPNENSGSWERVRAMLKNGSPVGAEPATTALLTSVAVVLFFNA